MEDISICMPIYYKESAETIRRCFDSLMKQTILPKQIVCALDDPSEPEVEECLKEIKETIEPELVMCYCERGRGLGAVLRTGVEHCTCSYIARMDVDDIALPERLEKEKAFLDSHPDVDVVGSNIAEFEDSVDKVIAYRIVPEKDEECKRMLKRRDPINHMTAMYRRGSILKAGNYAADMKSCEDTYLWTAFYQHGLRFANIQENLVLVHGGGEMYQRRGGKKAYAFVKKAIMFKKEVGLIKGAEALFQKTANYVILVAMPNSFRRFVYERILRKHRT